jgi:hypothetical protein
VSEVTIDGVLVLQFSEELQPIEFFSFLNLDLKYLNSNITKYIWIEYKCMGEVEEEQIDKRPKLLGYGIQNFTS